MRTLNPPTANRQCRRIFDVLRRDDGSVSVEFVIWVPFILMLLSLFADVSLMLHRQTAVLHEVQFANRALATGIYATANEAEDAIRSAISHLTENATVSTTLSSGVIDTSVLIPADDVMALGFLSAFDDMNLSVVAQHLAEE